MFTSLSLWPFSTEYFVQHWNALGGGHFVAAATGINIALLSWQAFREQVSAERQLEEKVNSVAASVADLLDASHYRNLVDKVLCPIRRIRFWAWKLVRGLAILAAPIGLALLYCQVESPYDLLLLLPTFLQLIVSRSTLAVVTVWMHLMRKGMEFFGPKIPSRQGASAEVTQLLKTAWETFDEDKKGR